MSSTEAIKKVGNIPKICCQTQTALQNLTQSVSLNSPKPFDDFTPNKMASRNGVGIVDVMLRELPSAGDAKASEARD